MISDDTLTTIRHLYFAQHFTMNAIADTLGVHHDSVKGALDLAGRPHHTRAVHVTLLAPFHTTIEELLVKTPKLRSTRIIQILQDRGYTGGLTQLRKLVGELRPKHTKAFHALTLFPAEQAQVDWASFGTIKVGRAERKLSCFVMVLAYSRATFAVFTFDQTLESFLRCHIKGFAYLRGVARSMLYDNLKSAVIERQGQAISFNLKLLELAGHYCFLPKAANVRAGWEKGRVERTIRYIRDNFFAGREFRDIDQANQELLKWLNEFCNMRPWPQDRLRTVAEVWQEEQAKLMPPAIHDFATDYVGPCRPNKICLVRYDRNDYSVPCEFVGRTLTMVASETTIRILDGSKELAVHARSYSSGERISDPKHYVSLNEQKPQAHARAKRAELIALIPEAGEFFERVIDAGRPTGNQTTLLFRYLGIYGKEAVRVGIVMALKRDICRAAYVGQFLAARDRRRVDMPVPPVILPDHPQISTSEVNPHALNVYDAVTQTNQGKDDEDE